MFDGNAWSTPPASIPDQPSLAHSGPFLASDGVNIWLFVIDSDAAATIRYNKFDGTTWGTWMAFETSTQTRTFLTGYSRVSNNSIGLLWAEARGSTYDLVVERFSTQ